MTDLLAVVFVAYNYGKIDMLACFNHRRRLKAESRQISQKLAARLKFLCSNYSMFSFFSTLDLK